MTGALATPELSLLSPPPSRFSSRRRRRRPPAAAGQARADAAAWVPVATHVLILALYLIPIFWNDEKEAPTPVLDELHLISAEHGDIYNPHATWRQIFSNDYWGRPMTYPSSHKSWRPLTILSFRFYRGMFAFLEGTSEVQGHRVWNVLTHAALAEAVSLLAVRLQHVMTTARASWYQRQCHETPQTQPQMTCTPILPQSTLLFRSLVKLSFALHPTHVEVTANAANRPHLLALLWAVWLCDAPLWACPILLVFGFLSSETFLFCIVPVAVTRSLLLVCERLSSTPPLAADAPGEDSSSPSARIASSEMPLPVTPAASSPTSPTTASPTAATRSSTTIAIINSSSMVRLLCTWMLLGFSGVVYYALRYHLDWLSIPDGLIRPAENPFFHLHGADRLRSYAYVTMLHIFKAWDLDLIGFSHEYGVACIDPVLSYTDPRFGAAVGFLGVYTAITVVATWWTFRQWIRTGQLPSEGYCWWILHLSWMVTLFPITGIIKVGTFVADRIVVPASTGTSICMAYLLTQWLSHGRSIHTFRPTSRVVVPWSWSWREGFLLGLLLLSWHRIHRRTLEWMGPVSLLESSLRTCPKSAKSHLEYSKTLSGLFPPRTNLSHARWHLEQVVAIDPTYCDVHQQLAHVAVQEHKYVEFEEHLTQAVICPFTMGGSMDTWKRYWSLTLDSSKNAPAAVRAAQERHQEYMKVINMAIEADEAKEEGPKSASPLIWKK